MIPELERVWPFIAPAVARRHGEQTKETLEGILRAGRARLFAFEKSGAITEVIRYPTGLRVANIWLAGGDLNELIAVEGPIYEWAIANGCTQARIQGRRGWLRAAPGFREIGTLMKRDL